MRCEDDAYCRVIGSLRQGVPSEESSVYDPGFLGIRLDILHGVGDLGVSHAKTTKKA